ncbi:MAG: hypothetical protein QM747_08680 [Nocardioides sp.]
MRLEALKLRFDVICAGSGAEELADAVLRAWDWCLADAADTAPADVRRRVTAVLDPEPDAAAVGPSDVSGRELAPVMDRLTPLVTTLALTERRSDLVMFHACAVADPASGHAVALYGPSGTGKTTVARTLGTDLVYLSDESAGVDDDLHVVPYPKPLSILATPGAGVKDQVSPGLLGLLRPEDRDYRLRGLVQLQRDPAHRGEAVLEPVPTVEALPELAAQTSFTREMSRPLHRLADLARHTGGVRRVTYAEAEQLRPLVRALLDGDA